MAFDATCYFEQAYLTVLTYRIYHLQDLHGHFSNECMAESFALAVVTSGVHVYGKAP